MGKKNKNKKRQFKRGDIVYFMCDDKVYQTTVMAVDGSEILTSYLEWENKKMFLSEGDPRIKDCVGEYIPTTDDWTEEMYKEQEEMLKKANA